MKRRLQDAGLLGRDAKKKSHLRLANKNKKLRWAKEHRHWAEEDWKKVSTGTNLSLRCLDHKEEHLWDAEKMKRCWRRAWRHLSSMVEAMWWSGGALVVVSGRYIQGKRDLEEGRHSILQRHAIPWTALNWSQFPPTTGQWPKVQLQTMQQIFREEAFSWCSVYNGVASIVTWSQPYWAALRKDISKWPQSFERKYIQYIKIFINTIFFDELATSAKLI